MAISLAQTSNYKSNTAHTHVLFKAKHLGVAYTFGRFNDFLAINRLSQSKKSKK